MGVTNTFIRSDEGTSIPVQEPIIISASRSTDIPAFYCDWFFRRLSKGYSAWTNPFSGSKMYVSYAKTRFIVFWSKNPRPLLSHIDELEAKGIKCYIQYTLNDYVEDGLEKGVPKLEERIETFKQLVERLGIGSVIWRFDPLILTDKITIDKLLVKVQNVGDQLKGFTEKLVFSFVDISLYKKVKNNLERSNILYHEWTEESMAEFASRLVKMNKERGWNYTLATCGEKGYFDGIEKNRCVDDDLIIRLAHEDKDLMSFLKVKIEPIPSPNLYGETDSIPEGAIILGNGYYATHGNNKDKGQREYCGCIKSKDIGQYNTCIHMCEYCYANASKELAIANWRQHKANPDADTITGR